ncbi:MAG: Tfp pilus assembly protein FimT/FimU [Xenococcaceae cyanobacterium]
MQQLNVQTKDRGFTLVEMIVTVAVAGAIAAVTVPNLVGVLNRNQVTEAQRQVESAFKEAQRQALRRGKSCSITITAGLNATISSPDGCLASNRNFGENTMIGGDKITINTNDGEGNTIIFSHKGIPNIQKVIVITSSYTDSQKCVAITDGIGTVRTGTYTGNVSGTLSLNSCTPAD